MLLQSNSSISNSTTVQQENISINKEKKDLKKEKKIKKKKEKFEVLDEKEILMNFKGEVFKKYFFLYYIIKNI